MRVLLLVAVVLAAPLALAGAGREAALDVSQRLDTRTDVGRDARFLADFDRSAISYSLEPDAIRAIDFPVFDEGDLLDAQDLVIGVERGGEAKAYPVKLLSVHEVVNDVVGGVPLAITWCPLCRTATAFERRIEGRVHRFGVSGLLYRGNLILFDRETGSLWSQLLGGAVTGTMRGRALRHVPVVQETWKQWRRRHPSAPVLSVAADAQAKRFVDPVEANSAYGTELTASPYSAYWSKVSFYFRREVRGVQDGALVVGVARGGSAKAYLLALVRERGAINDAVGGEPVVVVHGDDDALWGSVFSRRAGDRTLSFVLRRGRLVDRETGTRWDGASGRATAGPLTGTVLRRLPATSSYWFAWRGLYPRTALHHG